MVFELETPIFSVNQYYNWHYHVRSQHKQAIKQQTQLLYGRVRLEQYPYTVIVSTLKKGRQLDTLNCVSMVKIFVDALVENGVLPNDTRQYIDRYIFEGDSKHDKDVLRVEFVSSKDYNR